MLSSLLKPLGPVLFGLLKSAVLSLLSEQFIKEMAIEALRYGAKQTHTDVDDKMVDQIAEAWGVKE